MRSLTHTSIGIPSLTSVSEALQPKKVGRALRPWSTKTSAEGKYGRICCPAGSVAALAYDARRDVAFGQQRSVSHDPSTARIVSTCRALTSSGSRGILNEAVTEGNQRVVM